MGRLLAWLLLLAALTLVYTLAFTPFDHFAGRWRSTDTGGLAEVHIECPAPFSVLVLGAEPLSARDQGACVMPSRTLALEAGLALAATGLIVWKPLTRPRPEPIGRLSDTIATRPARRD